MTSKMMTTSRAAVIALIAAGPVAAPMAAFAQSDNATAPVTAPEAGAETNGMAAESDSTMAPADDSADMMADETAEPTGDPFAADGAEVAEAEEPAKPVEGQITMQSEDTILAEDLIGATVFNNADETVGDIDDLIIAMDGSVKGVVIGVGGFLGLGEKHVAIEMASLDVMNDEAGTPRLVTTANKADLEAAPEFVTAETQQREADNAAMQSGATGTETAPIQ